MIVAMAVCSLMPVRGVMPMPVVMSLLGFVSMPVGGLVREIMPGGGAHGMAVFVAMRLGGCAGFKGLEHPPALSPGAPGA